MAIGFRGGDDTGFNESDDRFGYGLREQADIKKDLIEARKLLTRAVLVGGLNKPLVVEITKFLNKLSNK